MTPELVANIHHEGGTVLGSSRGGFDLEKILQFLNTKKITCLFVIGGDGTHRGAFSKSAACGCIHFSTIFAVIAHVSYEYNILSTGIHEGCMEKVRISQYDNTMII